LDSGQITETHALTIALIEAYQAAAVISRPSHHTAARRLPVWCDTVLRARRRQPTDWALRRPPASLEYFGSSRDGEG